MDGFIRFIDAARNGVLPERAAWRVLGAGMAVSALLGLWLGRDVSFTVDEYSWISLIGQNGLGDLFDPYVGHLIVIPRLIYV